MAKPGEAENGGGAFEALKNPVGPKSRGVYVRRRLIVLAGLIAVVAVIVLVIVRPGSGAPKEPAQVEVPSDLQGGASGAEADSGDAEACADGQLKVTAILDKDSYAEGEYPQLSLSVENTGDAPCTANLGTSGMLFVVSSGEDQVWKSTDCQKDPADLAVILDPGKPQQSEAIEWDRTRSSKDTCEEQRDPVAAGGATYRLAVAVAGVASAETAPFLLY